MTVPSISSTNTVLVASDIFGMSSAFSSLLEDIKISDQALVLTPYSQAKTHFNNERQAYQCFTENGGIEAYIVNLTEVLQSKMGIKHIIAFSAGAAAIYKAVSNLAIENVHLTLFYPGQIRHFLNQSPLCPSHIIFPESEPNFSVPEVLTLLSQKSNLKVEQKNYQHGFMNKDSQAFNKTAYNYYCQMLKVQLSNI